MGRDLCLCLLQASGSPSEELFWRDADQYPSLLPRTHIQGSIQSLNVDRTILLNPRAVISAGKAGPWALSGKPGLGWIQGALLALPVAWPGCRPWCLGCCSLCWTRGDVLFWTSWCAWACTEAGTPVLMDVCPTPGVHVLLCCCSECSSMWETIILGNGHWMQLAWSSSLLLVFYRSHSDA